LRFVSGDNRTNETFLARIAKTEGLPYGILQSRRSTTGRRFAVRLEGLATFIDPR
jgi:hypothetical protein